MFYKYKGLNLIKIIVTPIFICSCFELFKTLPLSILGGHLNFMINKTSFSKMPSKRGFTLFLSFCLVAYAMFFLNGCSKNQFDAPSVVDIPIPKSVSPQDLEVKEQFFKPIEGLNPIFQKIKDNLQNQDSTDNFVTAAWVAKHGVPAWDKILTGVGRNEAAVQTRGNNSVNRMSFVPLKEFRTNVIKSFIAVYDLGGNKFGYRLYNREALSVFVASNENDKDKVVNLLAVFAYFEKTINGKIETYFPRPFDINLANIDVKIGNAKNRAQLENCIDIITYNQPIAYRGEWEIVTVCTYTNGFSWPASSTGGRCKHNIRYFCRWFKCCFRRCNKYVFFFRTWWSTRVCFHESISSVCNII